MVLCRIRVLQMLKQQQQRELRELDRSKLAVATQSEQLMAKYYETSEHQKRIVSRCDILHSCVLSSIIWLCSGRECLNLYCDAVFSYFIFVILINFVIVTVKLNSLIL